MCACACAQLEAAGCRLALAYALLGAPADTTRFGLVADVVATHGDANTAFAPIFSRFMVNVLCKSWVVYFGTQGVQKLLRRNFDVLGGLNYSIP